MSDGMGTDSLSLPHLFNLALHVGAGAAALAIGFVVLSRAKGTPAHLYWGRIFCGLSLLVCLSAAVGLAMFRFMPLFAVLAVHVAYQLIGGWRTVRRKSRGPGCADAALTLAASLLALPLVHALGRLPEADKGVAFAAMGALALVLFYDALRWAFPRRWHVRLWRYEHAYKMIATLSGMLSAMAGNVVRVWQPWSQLLPSVLGVLAIGWYFRRIRVQERRASLPRQAPDHGDAEGGEVA